MTVLESSKKIMGTLFLFIIAKNLRIRSKLLNCWIWSCYVMYRVYLPSLVFVYLFSDMSSVVGRLESNEAAWLITLVFVCQGYVLSSVCLSRQKMQQTLDVSYVLYQLLYLLYLGSALSSACLSRVCLV